MREIVFSALLELIPKCIPYAFWVIRFIYLPFIMRRRVTSTQPMISIHTDWPFTSVLTFT